MSRMQITSVILAATLVVAAVTVPAAATTSQSVSGTIPVTAIAKPTVHYTQLGTNTVLIRSNAGWTLTADTPRGAVQVTGSVTGGTRIKLPANATGYSVTLD
jgi:hypothetical protein